MDTLKSLHSYHDDMRSLDQHIMQLINRAKSENEANPSQSWEESKPSKLQNKRLLQGSQSRTVVQPASKTTLGKGPVQENREIRRVENPMKVKREKFEARHATAGAAWFNLPRTRLTPEVKRDLQLLRMRNVLDPKRHFKKSSKKNLVPEFSQIGTLIEGPAEFYSARLSRKERSTSLANEILGNAATTNRFKTKYGNIQSSKTSGRKAFYKAQKGKRSRRRF